MSDPRRLIDDDPGDFEASLLRAGRSELAPEGARGRVLARIGMATGVVAITATAASGAAAKGGGFFASALALKALGAAVLVGAVSVGGVQYAKHRRAVATPAPTPPAAVVVTQPAQPMVAAKPTVAQVPVAAPEAPVPLAPTVAPAPTTPSLPVIAAPASTLNQERALMDQANALKVSNPSKALALVDEYVATYPKGIFTLEAAVVRIDALAQLGRTAEAKALAQAFLAKHPDHTSAARLRKTFDTGTSPNP